MNARRSEKALRAACGERSELVGERYARFAYSAFSGRGNRLLKPTCARRFISSQRGCFSIKNSVTDPEASTALFEQTDAQWGRIVMTTSSSGLFNDFGQVNYGAAKMSLVGLMKTLALEGRKYGLHVNCLALTAATQMMEGILPDKELKLLNPDRVSPAMLALYAKDTPTAQIVCAGAGGFELSLVTLAKGVFVTDGDDVAETLLAQWSALADRQDETVPGRGFDQSKLELSKACYDPDESWPLM